MATGNTFVKSTEDSEETFDICCSPCSENGVIKEGKKFCVDCGSYLCDTCLQYHKQFPALRSHQIVDKSHSGSCSTAADVHTERCSIHPVHSIGRYCKDHDEICCEACVTIKHRSCKNVNRLTEVARGITDSREHNDTKQGLDSIVKRIKQEKAQRNKTLTGLDEKKVSALHDIEEFENKLISRIKELADVSKTEVLSRHAKHMQSVQSDIKELETVLSVAEDSAKKVSSSGLKEEQLFVNVKNGKIVMKDVGCIVAEISNNRPQNELCYYLDEKLTCTLTRMKSLGDYNDLPYRATKYKSVSVHSIELNAISTFEDGTFAFTDFCSRTLTRLNDNFTVRDKIGLAGSPVALCITGPQEVAAALRLEKKIQFVVCGIKMVLRSSFTTKMVCTGLCYDSTCDHLYVCQGAKWAESKSACVSAYKKDGTLLKTYEDDETGTRIFSTPNHIAVVSDVLYVADREHGLVALKKDCKRLWTLEDKKLKGAWGVCLLSNSKLLVTGFDSNNVIQVSTDGKTINELLGASEGLKKPFTVAFDKKNSRILVGAQNEINIYTLC